MRNTKKLVILAIVNSHSHCSLSVYGCKGILGLCAIEKNGKIFAMILTGAPLPFQQLYSKRLRIIKSLPQVLSH